MTKSYVAMKQHVCMVCCAAYDTGALLLDKRLKEREVERLCAELGLDVSCGAVTEHQCGYHTFIYNRNNEIEISVVWAKEGSVFVSHDMWLKDIDKELQWLIANKTMVLFPDLRKALIYIRLSKLLG